MKRLVFSICAAIWLSLVPSAMADEGPKAVVEATVGDIIAVLKSRENPNKLTEENRDAIRQAVTGRFDYRKMARGSLGKPFNKLSDENKDAFTEVFRELLERSYGNRLADYGDQTIRYGDAAFKKGKALVKSWVIDGEKEIPVYYRLYQNNDVWMVYDIKIEGVSLVGTFRKDFKSSMKRDGFEGLLSALKAKVERLKEKDAEED